MERSEKRTYRNADRVVALAERAYGIQCAREASVGGEYSVDVTHFEGVIPGRRSDRPIKVYERLVFKDGELDLYLYFDPTLGLTAEEREVMRGEPTNREPRRGSA